MINSSSVQAPSKKVFDREEIETITDLYYGGFFTRASPDALDIRLLQLPNHRVLIRNALQSLSSRNRSSYPLRFIPFGQNDYVLAELFLETASTLRSIRGAASANRAACDLEIALHNKNAVRIISPTEHAVVVTLVHNPKKLAWAIERLERGIGSNAGALSYIALFDLEISENHSAVPPNNKMDIMIRYKASDINWLADLYGPLKEKQLWDLAS